MRKGCGISTAGPVSLAYSGVGGTANRKLPVVWTKIPLKRTGRADGVHRACLITILHHMWFQNWQCKV